MKETKYPKYVGSEDNLTKSVAKYLDARGVLYTHVANELKANVKVSSKGVRYSPTGNKLKEMGKKSGVPDMLIFEARKGFNGLAIELKVGRNTSSEAQIMWQERLRVNGWCVLESKSLIEVMEVVDNYLR